MENKQTTLWIQRHHNAYRHLGPSYQLLPEKILQPILILHSVHKEVNYKKILCEIEACIKEEYEKDKKLRHEPWNRNEDRTRETLKILFQERKYALSRLFTLSQDVAFSGAPDICCDRYELGLEHDRSNIYFSLGEPKPYGDFLTCRVFRRL